jgi:hypothetical protein
MKLPNTPTVVDADQAHEYRMTIHFNTYGGEESSRKEFEELLEQLGDKFPGWSFQEEPMELYKL